MTDKVVEVTSVEAHGGCRLGSARAGAAVFASAGGILAVQDLDLGAQRREDARLGDDVDQPQRAGPAERARLWCRAPGQPGLQRGQPPLDRVEARGRGAQPAPFLPPIEGFQDVV